MHYLLTIRGEDLFRADLSQRDINYMKKCRNSNDISKKLKGILRLVRRIEEAQKRDANIK